MWKLSEDDEKENDYKRLQKKFAFNNYNKTNKSISQNDNVYNTEKNDTSYNVQYKTDNIFETNQSLRLEDINKIIEKNEMISKKNDLQIKEIQYKNQNKTEHSKSFKVTSRSKVNASLLEEETERNMNKFIDNMDNNPGLGDAVRKMTETSIDSLKDNIMKSKISNPKMSVNLRLPTTNFINHNFEAYDGIYAKLSLDYNDGNTNINRKNFKKNKQNNVVISKDESIQGS